MNVPLAIAIYPPNGPLLERGVHCTLLAQKRRDFQTGKDLPEHSAHSSRSPLSCHQHQSTCLPTYRRRSQYLKLPTTWPKWDGDIYSEPWESVLHTRIKRVKLNSSENSEE